MLCFVSRLYAGHDVETSGAMGVNTAHQCQPLTHCKKWVFRQHFLGGHPAATSFRASKHSGLVFRSQRCPPNECNGTPQRVFRRTRATRVIGPYRATGCLLLANIVFPHTVSAQSRLYWCFETRADQCWNTIPIRPVLLSTFLCAS